MKSTFPKAILCISMLLAACQNNSTITPDAPIDDRSEKQAECGFVIKVSKELARKLEDPTASKDALAGFTAKRTFPDAGRYDARKHREGLDRWYTIKSDPDMPETKAGDILSKIEGVELIEKNRPISNKELRNDKYFSRQWYLVNNGNTAKGYKAGCDIGIEAVWENGITGSDKVVVAVLDGGVEITHEDLADNIWSGLSPEGRVIHGFNFNNGTYDVSPNAHGTHVAGIISAVGNNGIGISGIAGGDAQNGIKGVKIMSCQILNDDKSGNSAEAMVWAADNGAIISQNSWGFTEEVIADMTDTPKYMKTAIDYFNKYAGCDDDGEQLPDSPMKGGVVIFAAGNESSSKAYPASYEGVIAVGATSADYEPAYYTNYGDWVDIAAPGGDAKKGHLIHSTVLNNKYEGMQGTSMACPTVSGVAALIISEYGGTGFTREELVERLLGTTRKISFSKPIGYMLNAEDALAHYDNYESPVPEIKNPEMKSAMSFAFDIIVPEANGDVKCRNISILYGKQAINKAEDAEKTIEKSTEGSQPGDTLRITISNLDKESDYMVSAVGYDAKGRASKLSQTVKVHTLSNSAPEISAIGDSSISIKKHETRSVSFDVVDKEGDSVECSLDFGKRNGVELDFDGKKATITVNGLLASVGLIKGRLLAKDACGETSSAEFSIDVLANNAPEYRKPIGDILSNRISETIQIDLAEHFSDPDGENLEYKISSNSDSYKYDIDGGILRLTGLKYGARTITVAASDMSGAKVSADFRYLCRNGEEDLEAYPVPVTSTLNLRAGAAFSSAIKIYNASGACVFSQDVESTPFEPAVLDLSGLKSGTYTLSAEIQGKSIKKNIIKK